MATYTNRYKFSNPGAGSCNWDYDQKRNRLIYDAVFDQDAKNNTVISGCAVSLAAGLSANITAGIVNVGGVEFEVIAGNVVLTGATVDPEQYNFISVDETGNLQVSTDPPEGNFVLIGVVDCDVVASVRIADCRNMAGITEDFGLADNILINQDISGSINTVNQRNFGGDWSSIAPGEYGFDRWQKDSNSGLIGQYVKDGNYVPGINYCLFGDNIQTIVLTAPASGHWYVTIPDTATNAYLIEGLKERPTRHRTTEKELALCQAYYFKITPGTAGYMYGGGGDRRYLYDFDFPVTMVRVPQITAEGGTYENCSDGGVSGTVHQLYQRAIVAVVGNYRAYNITYTADAEI